MLRFAPKCCAVGTHAGPAPPPCPRSDLDSHHSAITAVQPPHEFLKRPRNYQLSVAAHIFCYHDVGFHSSRALWAPGSGVFCSRGIFVSALLRASGRFLASYCVVSLCWGGGFDHPGTMCSNLLLGEQQGSTTPRTKIAFRITDRDAFFEAGKESRSPTSLRCLPCLLCQAPESLRLVSAKKLFSLVLLSDLLPGHGQFFQNTALILRLSLLG